MTTAIFKTELGGTEILGRYKENLKLWPVPAEHLRVPTRAGETFVVASGPEGAPNLVLFHGSGTNTTMWLGDVASWAEHFRVYAVDMIGEPGLSAPSRPPLDSEAYARWLDDVLDGLGIERTSIVGGSLGGWLALDYTTRRPERVERLAVLCPGGVGRQRVAWLLKVLVLRPFGAWGQRRSMRLATGLADGDASAWQDDMVATFRQYRPRRDRLPVFSDDALRRMDMPVHVIVGGRDVMFDSRETVERIERVVPKATTTLLPDVGHSIIGRTAEILAFLRG